MANIAAITPTEDLAAAAFTATASGGDAITVTDSSKDLVIEFLNNHSAAVTAIVTPNKTSFNVQGIGAVSKAAESLAVAGNGGTGVMVIPASLLPTYLDANSRVPITYTSHNALLLVRALQV